MRRDSRDGDTVAFCVACEAETSHKELGHGRRCLACGYCEQGDAPCQHLWMHFETGEDGSAYLNLPPGSFRWSEAVFVCTLCDLAQPEAWVEATLSSPRLDQTKDEET
jgi:hypothetical protein